MPSSTLDDIVIIDNGAYNIKAGLSSDDKPKIIPNAIIRSKGDRKTYIGEQLSQCRDYSSLYYKLAFEKGFLVNWEAEKVIWDGVFNESLKIDPTCSTLLITEPIFNLPNIQTSYDQMIFEEYEFAACHRTVTPLLASRNDFSSTSLGSFANECVLVIESGYSFTHIIPIVNGKILVPSVRRINVGGKLLTNHLKELVSFRQWNMMDQTYVMNQIKESCCFVSNSFKEDMEICKVSPRKNSIVQEYVLPDFSSRKMGYIRERKNQKIDQDEDQILFMNNERFTVPEILFHPSDIGMEQAGLTETIVESLLSIEDESIRFAIFSNIIVIGGNALFPGLQTRLEKELLQAGFSDAHVRIYIPSDPITFSWNGAREWIQTNPDHFQSLCVTRKEYEENGSTRCEMRFRM